MLTTSRYFVVFAGIVPVLLGLFTLVGWYSHNTTLLQINPAFVPMQYNTALCFLFSGAGLLALHFRIYWLKIVSAGLLLSVAGLTLLQYVFTADFGIDQLLMEYYLPIETAFPGRMAPNTALSFLFTGCAVLTAILSTNASRYSAIKGVLGVLVFCLGFVALAGYFIDVEAAYGWGKFTHMAVHTAAGFNFVGLGLFAEYLRSSRSKSVVGKSLAVTTISRMLIATTIVVLISTVFIYLYIMSTLESETRNSLAIYISERGKLESFRFEEGERSHALFRQRFFEEFDGMDTRKLTDRFEDLFRLADDGSYRTRVEAYEGMYRANGTFKQSITGFVMEADVLTDELKSCIMLLEHMVDHYGAAWNDRFPNLGIVMPENVHIAYWPGSRFALNVSRDDDMREREWYRLALANPNKTVYSGLNYDSSLGEWAVSAATAVFDGSRHLFTVVNDIKSNELTEKVLTDPLAGTYNFIARKNGDLILDPRRMVEISEAVDAYNVFDWGDSEFTQTIKQINANASAIDVLTDNVRDRFIAYTTIAGPEWYLVTSYPRQLLRTAALQVARVVLLLGLFLIVLETGLLFLLFRLQVIQPLTRFISAINKVSSENFTINDDIRKDLPLQREDELGELARAFNAMAGQIQDYSTSLEDKVEERTRALSEAQENIVEQKEMLNTTLENMDQGVVMTDEGLNILIYNSRYPQILTLPDTVTGEHSNYAEVMRYFRENVLQETYANAADLIADESKKERFVYTIDLPDERTIEVRHMPMEGGHVRIFTDITEREQARLAIEKQISEAEEANRRIHESQQLLEGVIENCGAAIYVKDIDGQYLMVNRYFEQVAAQKREAVLGRNDVDIYPAEVAEQIRRVDREVIESAGLVRAEEKLYIEGEETTFLSLKFPLFNVKGEIDSICGISTDISEQKTLQRKIQQSEERFQLAMESAGIGLWDADALTGQAHYNDQYFKMLGYDREEFHAGNKSWLDLVHEDDRALALDKSEELARGEVDSAQYEFRMIDINGEQRSVLSIGRISSRDENNKPTRILGIHLDITNRKMMEEEIRQAKEVAEAASKAKANFLAAMSHEIRTPMNGIIGMVDLLRQSNLSRDHKQMLQTINDSGQALLSIINDILDFSKIEAGKLELESVAFSVLDTLEGSVETVRPAALKKELKLLAYVDPAIPPYVWGDPVRLRQILINLCGNAIKFTDSGLIVVRADLLESDQQASRIRFSVIDNGIGISGEGQQRLFQEFSQADTSTTRKYGGTGLGLSICQSLAEMMGGDIGVKSELGKGSEFYVNLPLVASAHSGEEPKVKDLSGLRVLLVNDNPMESFVCQQYLQYWNAEVRIESQLEKCRQACEDMRAAGRAPDVVVLGSDLERGKKFALRKSMLELAELSNIKFVILMMGRRSNARLESRETVTLDVNPLKRVAFLSAVSIAAGRASPEIHHEEVLEDLKAERVALSPQEALEQGELILVAEDNLTNQDVITRQLKMLGYTCEMKNDGRQALEAWQTKDYAILLTDCHMPEMDGFELTDSIRQREASEGKRIPIIAITANVLQGEAERCLAAGMDDYMSKPIDMKVLRDKLNKWMPQAAKPRAADKLVEEQVETKSAVSTGATENAEAPLDERTLKDMFGEDDDTFSEILHDFIEASGAIVEEIKQGHTQHSAEAVKQAAHKLKSSSRSVGANKLADICLSLEQAGKDDDWDTINAGMAVVDGLMAELEDYVNAL